MKRSSNASGNCSNDSPLVRRIVPLLALLVTALLFIPFMPVLPRAGLDPSWRAAINVAVEKGYVFGRDLIFTFGPLGSVYSAGYSPATDLMTLLGSSLYAAGFVISIHLSASGRRQWWAIVLPLLACLFVMRDVYFLALPFFLMLAVMRATEARGGAYRLEPTPAVIAGLALATLAMSVGPIVKGSFSGVVLPVGGLTFLVLLLANVRAALGFAVLALIGLAGSWVLAGQSLSDLPEFFIAQGPIISGYTNAMSLGGGGDIVGYFLLSALIIFSVFSYWLWRAFGKRSLFACLALAFTLFISFKAGFVRQDDHVFIATGVLLLLAYGTALYATPSMVIGVWALAGLVWFLAGSTVFQINGNFLATKLSDNWRNTYLGIKIRATDPGMWVKAYEEAQEKIRADHPLPVTQGTVDVYPTELSAIFANKLDWSGRPIPQSYSAYDPILIAKNVAHLKSARAPDTVFFSLGTIDGRFPALDDSGNLLELLAGYSVSGVSLPYVIMNKHAGARGAELDSKKRVEMRRALGEAIELNDHRPLWMQVDIQPTLLGKAVSALFRLPQVQIEIILDNGVSFRKRIIPKTAQAGFIVSPYLESASDVVSLAAGINVGPKVKAVRIHSEGARLWQSNFDVSMTPINITPQESARSLVLSAPQNEAPEWISLQAAGSAQCTVDSANGATYRPGAPVAKLNGVVLLQGWIGPNIQNEDTRMQIWGVVERSGMPPTYYKAKVMSRPDVAAALKRPDLTDSGFILGIEFPDEPGSKKISLISIVRDRVFTCPESAILVQGN